MNACEFMNMFLLSVMSCFFLQCFLFCYISSRLVSGSWDPHWDHPHPGCELPEPGTEWGVSLLSGGVCQFPDHHVLWLRLLSDSSTAQLGSAKGDGASMRHKLCPVTPALRSGLSLPSRLSYTETVRWIHAEDLQCFIASYYKCFSFLFFSWKTSYLICLLYFYELNLLWNPQNKSWLCVSEQL